MTYLETGIYQLSTLAPIHIRAGKLEYGEGTLRVGNTVYVVDTRKLQAEIFETTNLAAVEKYAKAFSNPNSNTRLADVLDQIDYDYKANIDKITSGVVRTLRGNPFIQSGLGTHFVPGSSIKGAIKTAVLYHSVKQRITNSGFDLNDFIKKKIDKYSDRKSRESFAEDLLKEAFQSVHPQESSWSDSSVDGNRFAKLITSPGSKGATLETLEGNELHLPIDKIFTTLTRGNWIKIDAFEETDGQQVVDTFTKIDSPPNYSKARNNEARNNEPPGPFTDIFRAVKVKDAIIEDASLVKSEEVLFTTLNRSNQVAIKRMGGNRWYECFHGQTKIEISIDLDILQSFTRAGAQLPFSNLDDLIQLCQNFSQAQWDAEKQFLDDHSGGSLDLEVIEQFYADPSNKQRSTLRVGWGTGMLGTTLSLLLDESTRVDLRNKVISDGYHVRPKPAPKSRRFVLKKKQAVYPLGWIELA